MAKQRIVYRMLILWAEHDEGEDWSEYEHEL